MKRSLTLPVLRAAAALATVALMLAPHASGAQEGAPATTPPAGTPESTPASTPESAPPSGFESASQDVQQRLEQSVAALSRLRDEMAAEKVPLSRRLGQLEAELSQARAEYQSTTRLLDGRSLDLSTLRAEIKGREDELGYLSNLLSEYARNFETRIHVSELQRYAAAIEAAKLAPENSNLDEAEVFAAQTALVRTSLERLHETGAGARFDGNALDTDGLVKAGTFVLVGHAALFRSADGAVVGTVEQRLGSLEPSIRPLRDPAMIDAASQLVVSGFGRMPFDPTQGNAALIEETDETLQEHIAKGGPVMVPILVMAAAALLVALFKWGSLSLVRRPSRRVLDAVLEAVGRGDDSEARRLVAPIKGPVGEMLREGVKHMREPRELVEEVMYETVLKAKLRLQSFLPFIAICAASAPLLGLLGTVTGIINTFKLLTVYGSGDVKSLSGGISEALITTEYGLIVAIPALLLHSFLSRKASGITSSMETSAVAFANRVALAEATLAPIERRPEPATHSTRTPAGLVKSS